MVAYKYNYKYVIKVAPIANITISEPEGDLQTTAIEPISTFINSDVLTEEIETWITDTLPESMINNSYVDYYTGDIYNFSYWAYYGGITNFPYVKEMASSENTLNNLDWFAGLPEGKVYFAYVEEQAWWNGELQDSYMALPFIFRLPFLSEDNQLGTNLVGESSDFVPE